MNKEQSQKVTDLAFRLGLLIGNLEGDFIECHILYQGGQLKEPFTKEDLDKLKELMNKLAGIFYIV